MPVIESQCIGHLEVTDSFDLDSSCHPGTKPWNRYWGYISHLAQVSIRARSPERNSRPAPKHIVAPWCMSRQGTVCRRRRHDIGRPDKEWLQELVL